MKKSYVRAFLLGSMIGFVSLSSACQKAPGEESAAGLADITAARGQAITERGPALLALMQAGGYNSSFIQEGTKVLLSASYGSNVDDSGGGAVSGHVTKGNTGFIVAEDEIHTTQLMQFDPLNNPKTFVDFIIASVTGYNGNIFDNLQVEKVAQVEFKNNLSGDSTTISDAIVISATNKPESGYTTNNMFVFAKNGFAQKHTSTGGVGSAVLYKIGGSGR